MTEYYLDASALVKRYADEAGSVWIRQITDIEARHTIMLAEITLAEVAAALAVKHRVPGGITQKQRDRALSRFLQDCAERGQHGPIQPLLPGAESPVGLQLSPPDWPDLAQRVRLMAFCKSPRGPKKPRPKREGPTKRGHVSAAKLLMNR